MDLESSKSSKIKNIFSASKKPYLLGCIYTFLLYYESAKDSLTFSKNKMFGKNLVLQLWNKKNCGPIRMQDSFN